MKFNPEAFRAVVRLYASNAIGLPLLLEKLWPLLADADDESKESVESIQDLLALHAARSIDDVALRQRLIQIAFPPATIASIALYDVRSSASKLAGGLQKPIGTESNAEIVQPIPA